MTELKISTVATSAKIEALYEEFEGTNSAETILVIPGYLSKYRFGLLSDILRLVINLNEWSKIITVKIDVDAKELDRFYDQEYSFPIIAYLWNTSSFIDKNGKDIKALLRVKQIRFLEKMNSLSKLKGTKYLLVNTDHSPKDLGLIKLLENSDGFNDDENKITQKLGDILKGYILTYNKKNLLEIEPIINDIGAIIYELVKNTFEWGRTDENNVDLLQSIRGAYIRFHTGKNENIVEEFRDTPLEDFFGSPKLLKESMNNQKKIYYLEILVFDTGVGFVEKFGKSEAVEDIDVIKKCLIKNQTSSITNMKSKKGKGLDRILNILDGKGFLKITTDKYRLYRNLAVDRYKPINKNNLDGLVLNHWKKGNELKKDDLKSRGTYLSILYPFNN